MSVLFKALSRAAEQNRLHQAASQTVPVFHTQTGRGGRWRSAFLGAVAATAVLGAGGLWLAGSDYADLFLDAPPLRQGQRSAIPASPVAATPPASPVPATPPASPLPTEHAPAAAVDRVPPAAVDHAGAPAAAPPVPAPEATPTLPQSAAAEPHGDTAVAPDADLTAVLESIRRRQMAKATGAPVTVQRTEPPSQVSGLSVRLHETAARDDVAAAYEALTQARFEQALSLYDAALAKEPRNVSALVGRASVLHKLGRLDEARPAYDRALSVDPTNTQALGNLLALIGDSSPHDALTELARLRALNPRFSPIPAQMASVHARAGNVAQAVASLREAIGLSPENALYRYNLAVLLDRAGHTAEAVEAYDKVLAGRSESLPLDQIRERVRFLRGR